MAHLRILRAGLLSALGFGVFISLFFPAFGKEDVSPKNLLRKGAAAILVGAGVLLINF